jgi:hypothetical protein
MGANVLGQSWLGIPHFASWLLLVGFDRFLTVELTTLKPRANHLQIGVGEEILKKRPGESASI